MSIRMSTSQLFSRGLNSMLDVQKAVSKTQEQIATNKRVLTPADDPIAATRILQLNQELADLDKYNSSLSLLSNRMLREETALTGLSQQLQKAQEIVLQSGNAVINADQRKYLATELQSVVDSMAQLMNAKDSSGEFLFSGYQGKTQPFVQDAEGRYRYQGDEGQRFVQVGPVTSIAANDSGYQVFMNIPGINPSVEAKAGAGNTANPPAQISGTQIRNAARFAEFAPASAVIEFGPVGNINPPGLNYTVRQISDGRILAENVPYVSGSEIEFAGLVMRIQGRPAEGDSFIVESSNKKGLLEGIQDFIADLQRLGDNTTDRATLTESIKTTLGNLDNAQVQMLQTRSAVGARMNQIDSAQSSNDDFALTIRTALSELQDLDYAKAISQLTQETFVLEAAQTSFAKISRLSLFDLI
ncbi:MAG: flagellar hook-associated protein FlgL [Pseudohongiella sp.]|nr:flagellar hook-associated protein FlgL [Pseudohongiella sp.]MDO9521640.1 flagellar hook-associated protein FlgL [Pseudohongiella sp.]MDP2127867.1 flagellar hook-associated protein FlgL [Pseudohongiella sp.]